MSMGRGHWRPEEDEKLMDMVARFGPHNWNAIAENIPGRTGKSCRLRWFNQLDPRIDRSPFSEKEEERLLAAHRLHGNRWSAIARMFPGRTDNAIKNHWHVLAARRKNHAARRTLPRVHGTTAVEFYDFLQVRSSAAESGEATTTTTKCSSSVDQEEEEEEEEEEDNEEEDEEEEDEEAEQWRKKHGGVPFIDFLRVRSSSSCAVNYSN